MGRRLRSAVLALALLAMPLSAAAQPGEPVTGDRAADMVLDAVVMRPLGLVATVLGAALTVVTLPFTIPSGSVGEAARELIVRPAAYTFKRPLGDFSDSGEADY